MSKRQIIALLALVGACISVYLTLFKLGIIGTLSCSIGSCEQVNTSKWARLLGAPVAAWGVGFYVGARYASIGGQAQMSFLSPATLFSRPTLGQNLLAFTHGIGNAADSRE